MAYSYKGSISFGLVYIPVTLHSTIKNNDIGFNMIDKKTMSRVKYKKTCADCDGREVRQEDIVKGYEYEEGKYVLFDEKDFEKLKSKKDKNITTDSVEKIWYSPANDGYCGGINHQHYNSTRYHALNLHSFFQKGTVEFRLFNSTLHAGKIKAYVQFCLALSAWAIESDDKVVFRSMNGYTAQKKITLMYNILTNRLGLYGDEFKTCRLHMMKQLRENAKAEQVA